MFNLTKSDDFGCINRKGDLEAQVEDHPSPWLKYKCQPQTGDNNVSPV